MVKPPAPPFRITPPLALPGPLSHRYRLDSGAAPAGEGMAYQINQAQAIGFNLISQVNDLHKRWR
jgi:hypothetical protein